MQPVILYKKIKVLLLVSYRKHYILSFYLIYLHLRRCSSGTIPVVNASQKLSVLYRHLRGGQLRPESNWLLSCTGVSSNAQNLVKTPGSSRQRDTPGEADARSLLCWGLEGIVKQRLFSLLCLDADFHHAGSALHTLS